ncbi:cytochrome P450 [Streptomyces wuyuanensis]|uniref:cytochrome P450 n=1 Tax=Streptomyces wuyuanensis TaxID=1196353 RepID=UPI00343628D7
MTSVPVAPGNLPVIGHAWMVRHRSLPWLRSLYPYEDIVKVYLGPKAAYLPIAPELLYEVLVTKNDCFSKGPFYEKMQPLIGNSLGMLAGDAHSLRRRLVQPAFHVNIVARYFDVIREQTAAVSGAWQPGRQLALDDEITGLMLAISARSLFSARVEHEAVTAVQRTLPVVMEGFFKRAWAATRLPEKLPTAQNRRFNAAVRDLRRALFDLIIEYRGEEDHGDVLSMLLGARDKSTGQGMSDLQVRDEVIGLLTASCEDIGTTLAWAFWSLAKNPLEQERIHAELDTVVAGRRIEYADVERLEYLQCFLNEVLRLRPPWLTTRHTQRPVKIGNYTIPANTTILVSPYLQHHNPRIYQNPEHLDPERWGSENRQSIPRGAYIPFGTGAHVCPGRHFAMLVARTVVAIVLTQWRLELASGAKVKERVAVSIHPTELPVAVTPRPSGPMYRSARSGAH